MRTDLSAQLGPIKWGLAPLWSVAPRVDNKNTGVSETNLLSLSYGRVVRKDIDAIGGLRPESYATYNIIEPGDIVLRMTDLQNDQKSIRTGQTSERGIITSAYITVRPDTRKVEPRFLAAVLRAYDIQKTYYKMGAGVRQNLGYPEFTDLPVPTPDLPTQRRIADFLDRETGEIDAMITKMDELAGQLEVRKLSAIEHAIEGVGPSVKLGLMLDGIKDGTHGSFARVESGSGKPLLGARNIMRSSVVIDGQESFVSDPDAESIVANSFPRRGDVLLVIVGATIGKTAVYELDESHAFQRSVAFLRPGRGLVPKFLWHQIQSRRFQQEVWLRAKVSAQPGIYLGDVAQIPLIVPGISEQERIADHLDVVTGKIDAMLAKVSELKSLLTERRAALITDVVTGRKDVA